MLDIPSSLAVFPVFHPSRLSLASPPLFTQQHAPPPAPVQANNPTTPASPHDEWLVQDIADFRISPRYRPQYKATFRDEWLKWNSRPPWQYYTDFLNSKEKIAAYHEAHPELPPSPVELRP
ncbi:hypothetical protein KEM55_008083 [Ascosphaera atra]|nr:hypothetical protein KEM55_008083 [Ascosphaera atra]